MVKQIIVVFTDYFSLLILSHLATIIILALGALIAFVYLLGIVHVAILHPLVKKCCFEIEEAQKIFDMPIPIVVRDPNLGQPKDSALKGKRSMTIDNTSKTSSYGQSNMEDISTSPRFLGYIFSFFSSAVLLASSVMFYVRGVYPANSSDLVSVAAKHGINITTSDLDALKTRYDAMDFSSKLFLTSGGVVTQNYQVYGSIAVSSVLTTITLVVVFAHLDSFCCPNFFRHFFRDGSKSERNLIIALIVISTVSLQICTSRFSIGEAQINVFFSTWTNFISCVLNFEVWRNGAGRHSTFQNVLFDRDFPLKKYWFVLSIFTTVSFLSMIDFFLSK